MCTAYVYTAQDVQDDMAELMDTSNEIQEVMGRAYGVPEDLDEVCCDDMILCYDVML